MFVINPADVEKEAINQGFSRSELTCPPLVILTFNRGIIDELFRQCGLKDWEWASAKFSPYAPPAKSFKGKLEQTDITVIIPPMGASPLISLCEELVYFGAEMIFLLCASWGLGEKYLQKGQVHLPSFAVGMDGTSPHYGNKDWRIENDPKVLELLARTLNELKISWKEGGVGSCEALYRLTPEIVHDFREQGCLSVENGETAALFSFAKEKGIPMGVLLQPYIDLEQGWQISYMDEAYIETCKIQARAAVKAMKSLLEKN